MKRFATKIALVVTVMFAFAGLALVPAASATTETSSEPSAVTATVTALVVVTKPSIVGNSSVGYKLTAQAGEWSPGATDYDFRWYINGVTPKGGYGMYYLIKAADFGKTIVLRVIAKRDGYLNGKAFSKSVVV